MPLVRTFTENLMAYALGRRVEYFDQPTIRAIAKAAEANDYKMSSFILGVVKSDAFRMKRAEPAATDDRNDEGSGSDSHQYEETETMHFITGKHMPRRTFLRGAWAPRWRCRSSTRWCRPAGRRQGSGRSRANARG